MSAINRQHKHIFIHVPKTAGTSMEMMPFVGGSGHQAASVLLGQCQDLWSWGFVRNPYDRLYSVWCAIRQHTNKAYKAPDSFEEFVLQLVDYAAGPHTKTQSHYLCDRNLKILVDFVGRFENLASDWEYVQRQIGVEPVPLPVRNSTAHGPWQEVYTGRMLRAVNLMYRSDFKAFDYRRLT